MVGPDGVIHLELNMARVMDPIGRSFKLAPQLSPTSAILLQPSPGHPGQTFCLEQEPSGASPGAAEHAESYAHRYFRAIASWLVLFLLSNFADSQTELD
ncbi:hypothetical protein ALUC_60707A [Aspergillus luchuensis]|nr:hypothetical protein ALUC_60707A [Aspergillus luchuensis]